MAAPSAAPANGLLTIAQAADQMGVKPWEVVRRIDAGELPTVTLVPATALRDNRGAQA